MAQYESNKSKVTGRHLKERAQYLYEIDGIREKSKTER